MKLLQKTFFFLEILAVASATARARTESTKVELKGIEMISRLSRSIIRSHLIGDKDWRIPEDVTLYALVAINRMMEANCRGSNFAVPRCDDLHVNIDKDWRGFNNSYLKSSSDSNSNSNSNSSSYSTREKAVNPHDCDISLVSSRRQRKEKSQDLKGDVEVTETDPLKSERRTVADLISHLSEEVLNIVLTDCASQMIPEKLIGGDEMKSRSRMSHCNLDESRTESEKKSLLGREEERRCRLSDSDGSDFNLNLNLRIKGWVERGDSEALLIDIISCPIRNLQKLNSTNATSSSTEQLIDEPKRKRERQDGEQSLENCKEDSKEVSGKQIGHSSVPISEHFPYLTPIFFSLPMDLQIRTITAITLKLKRYSISRLQLCREGREIEGDRDGDDIQEDEGIYFNSWDTAICCRRVMAIAEKVMKSLVDSTDSQKITLGQYEVLMACVGDVSGKFIDFYQCCCQFPFSICSSSLHPLFFFSAHSIFLTVISVGVNPPAIMIFNLYFPQSLHLFLSLSIFKQNILLPFEPHCSYFSLFEFVLVSSPSSVLLHLFYLSRICIRDHDLCIDRKLP